MRAAFDWKRTARLAITLALSVAGGLAAHAIGLPAAWVSGGLLAVAVASLAGVDTDVPAPLRPPVYLVLGIYAGSGVTPETLQQMRTWPASFAILAASVVALIAGSYLWLHRRCGWDRSTALLSSLPGALSFVLAAAEDLKVDFKKVAIAQSIRLLILVELIPLTALLIGHPVQSRQPSGLMEVGPLDLLILFGAAIAAGLLLERLRVPGGWMLGALMTTAALLLGGVVDAGLPYFLVVPCLIALAAIAGSRFRPGDLVILPRIAGAALGAFAIAIAISALSAGMVSLLLGVSFIQALLAFAPGALDALVVLANQMNIDPAYVAAHHLARFLALAAAVPFLARWLDRRT